MAIPRTKKLTDATYSPTIAVSEETIRSQVDGAIQEVLDLGESNFTAKMGDHLGTWRGLTPTQAEPGLSATVEAHLAENTAKFVSIDTEFDELEAKRKQYLDNTMRVLYGVSGDSENAHYSTFDYTKAFNGINTINASDASSGWLANTATLNNWIKFKMPIGVVIGDSIAEGHPNTHGRLHLSDGSVDLNKLNEVGQISLYLEQHARIAVYNHGIGSQTFENVRARWNRDVLAQEDLALIPITTLSKKPTFVLIVCGINDVWTGRTFEQLKTDAEWCIDSAISNNMYPIVFNIGPHALMTPERLAIIKQYNAWLVEKAQSTPKLKVIDFYAFANDPANDGKPLAGLFFDDVHPTKDTYRKLSDKICKEAFNQDMPAVVPRYINLSPVVNPNNPLTNYSRPTCVLVHINNVPKQYYLLPNSPNQSIKIPKFEGIISTIKVEIVWHEPPSETPANTTVRTGFGEIYLTDVDLFNERVADNIEEQTIIQMPCSSAISICKCAIPDAVTPGNVTYANADNLANAIGIFASASDGVNPANIATDGIVQVEVSGAVYKNDLLVTTTTGALARATTPTAGTVVAKVIKPLGAAGRTIARLL
jgi:lysophospholipase L1-like esterase